MPWILSLIFLFLASLSATPVRAIETSGGYNTTPPTSSNIPNWNIGWGNANVTGWNYGGIVDGKSTGNEEYCSGVYLGNGWVLTAGHVGWGNFTLNGILYTPIPDSAQTFTDSNGTADLCLFAIASPPSLPSLIISSGAPVAFASKQILGSTAALLGIGGASVATDAPSWGIDTVTEIDEPLPVTATINGASYTFNSHDFFTDNGTVTRGSHPYNWSIINNSMVVNGDSGGGDFIYNSTTQKWELAGINEATGSWTGANGDPYYGNGSFSAFVQLSYYASQITPIIETAYVIPAVPTDTPTMPLPAVAALACALLLAASRSLGKNRA